MPALRLLLSALVLTLLAVPATASAVVGGETTQREWPHMAGMEYKAPDSDEWRFRCGASLVRPDVILTAAHCVDDAGEGTLPAERFRFLLGTKKRSQGGERIAAVKIVEHPGYNGSGEVGSDVALVKLARPSTLGRTIRVGEPADKPRWEPGDPSVIIGWGTEFSESPTIPDDLKEAEIPIVSDDECALSYEFTLDFDPATAVCAGNRTGGEDSCQGDSGGPLMVTDAGGAWIQVGVVSYGLGCAFPTQYGVYAEAGGDALRGWIAQNADAIAAEPSPPAGPAPGAPGAATPGGAASAFPVGASPLRARLTISSILRRTRRSRRVAVTVRTTAPLRSIRVTLKRGKRTIATGRRAALRGKRGRIFLTAKSRRLLRSGRVTIRLTATDTTGRRLTATRRARLRG